MTRLFVQEFAPHPVFAPAFALLSRPVARLPGGPWDSSVFGDAPHAPDGGPPAFIFAVGGDERPCLALDADWDAAVMAPLALAFQSLTGAARFMREHAGGAIAVVLPSPALVLSGASSPSSVLLRSLLGMAEALRAELTDTEVGVTIVFFDPAAADPRDLALRLERSIAQNPMYSLSSDFTASQINGAYDTICQALDRTTEGPPLPDIGPMAAVYLPHLIRPPGSGC